MGAKGDVHAAFGTLLRVEFPLPELGPPGGAVSDIDAELVWAEQAEIDAAFSGPACPAAEHWGELGGGARFHVEGGRAGDMVVQLDGDARFHFAPDAGVVRCTRTDPDDVRWRRFVLDTVLGTVALLRGREIIHAGAYERPEGVVAIVAGSGGGKSTLLAELVRRGRPLFCDDLLVLEGADGDVVAQPGPPLLTAVSPLPDGTPVAGLGRVLAEVDGETWVVVPRALTAPRPVAAVAFLERGGDEPLQCAPMVSSVVPLLRNALHSGAGTDRLRARFELLSDLASTTPLLRLAAPLTATPAATADALEAAIDRAGASAP